MQDNLRAKLEFVLCATVFGTVGVVSSVIPLHSDVIVFYRALIAFIFLVGLSFATKRKFNIEMIKSKFGLLILTGIFMGFNWVFLFEAFRVASVSVGTVCYNTMPIFVMMLAPIVFKEKITIKNVISIAFAMIGVVLVSNVLFSGFNSNVVVGSIYGLLGALFYALVVIVNKKLTEIDSYDKIIVQFLVSVLIMIPYMLFITKHSIFYDKNVLRDKAIIGILMLLLLSIVHTGIIYIIYFNSVNKLKAEEVAILTYIDPAVSLILSGLVLKEKLNFYQMLGAMIILVVAVAFEVSKSKQKSSTGI